MASERITITLPPKIAQSVKERARRTGRPVSRVIAEAIKQQDDADLRERMIQGYKESAALNKQMAEEGLPLFVEVLDDHPAR